MFIDQSRLPGSIMCASYASNFSPRITIKPLDTTFCSEQTQITHQLRWQVINLEIRTFNLNLKLNFSKLIYAKTPGFRCAFSGIVCSICLCISYKRNNISNQSKLPAANVPLQALKEGVQKIEVHATFFELSRFG